MNIIDLNIIDLNLLSRIVRLNLNGQTPVRPDHGEAAAAKRLEKHGLVYADNAKPPSYCPTNRGFRACEAMINMLETLYGSNRN